MAAFTSIFRPDAYCVGYNFISAFEMTYTLTKSLLNAEVYPGLVHWSALTNAATYGRGSKSQVICEALFCFRTVGLSWKGKL